MRALALTPALIVFALATPSAATPTPTFSKLPVGAVTEPPTKKAPVAIGARETVPGFFLASPSWPANVALPHRFLAVVGSPEQADAIRPARRGKKVFDAPPNASGTCFSEASGDLRSPMDEDGDGREPEWREFLEQVQTYPKTKDNPRSGVAAVHSERFVEQGGGAAIESVDAWVDPATRGVRLIGKATLPLVPVATTTGGLRVFAGRDERPGGKKLVQFVLVPPRSEHDRPTPTWVMRGDGDVAHGGCSHLRVGLAVEDLDGDHAVFRAEVRLPDGPKPESASKAKDAPEEIRVRPVEVQVSVSKTSRDKEPVVSVSYGWAGRERFEHAF